MSNTKARTINCHRCHQDFIGYSNARKYCDDCQRIVLKEQRKRAWTKNNKKQQAKEHNTYTKGKTKCLICGAWVKAPSMHAWQFHRVTAREYKEEFQLPFKKGLLPEELKEIKREHVFQNETVKNLEKGASKRYKKGEERVYAGVLRRAELGQTKQPRINQPRK